MSTDTQTTHHAMNGSQTMSSASSAQLLLAEARNAAYAEAAAGRISQGMTVLYEALLLEPMSYELLSDIAALMLASGELEHAAAYARKAVGLMPHHGPSLYTLGFALAGLCETALALQTLTRLTHEGSARTSLLLDAPELMPLVYIEIDRLQRVQDAGAVNETA